jgi:hypothetical protein
MTVHYPSGARLRLIFHNAHMYSGRSLYRQSGAGGGEPSG